MFSMVIHMQLNQQNIGHLSVWRLCCLSYLLFQLLIVGPTAFGERPTWPQWRGPHRTDVSDETGLLQDWPDGGPVQEWLYRQTGIGYSGPAVVGDKLFILGARNGVEMLIALDVERGEELWASEVGTVYTNNWGDGPRSTPTVDGKRVYALNAQGNLACVHAEDGRIVWQRTMQDFGGAVPSWGYCESVLIDGEKVVCTPGGNSGALVALNKKSGDLLWQSQEFVDGAQYASIIAVDHHRTRQYVQLTMDHVVGISAEDGRLLWQSDWPGATAVVATPIYYQGQVYVTSGYSVGCKLVDIGSNNEPKDVYFNKIMKNHHGGVILVNGNIYGYSDGVGWLCQSFATGKKIWAERKSLGKGSISYADNRFYCLSESDGTVVLIAASQEGWKEHGRLTLEPQTELRKPSGAIWTHPVIVDGRMYLRDQDLLFCYDVKRR